MGKRKHVERVNDDVIVDEVRVSVSDLKKKAVKANRRFWGLLCSLVLVSSMILPYMSQAAVAGQDSDVFTGIVVPGYSMGGLEITAYGIDINKWGKVTSDKAVKSNYGVWSGDRGDDADNNLQHSSTFVALDEQMSANYNLSTTDKSLGWQGITGKTGYTASNPDGLAGNNQSEQADVVSPYRTVNDYQYWTSQTPRSGDNASASITVSLFPDFVVLALGKDENGSETVVLPESADDYRTQTKKDRLYNKKGGSNPAIPYYVPLRALFDEYNISDAANANINVLMEHIRNNPDGVKNALKKSNLLDGTTYKSLNSDEGSQTEDSFNPYPYSMVFSTETDNGQVVSSIYENSEAYVYFSPASVYSTYMKLKEEYEQLRSAGSTPLKNKDQVTTFQLGYYLAGMAILEAYLEEALPQDMTRGYVGPSETPAIARASDSDGAGQLASGQSAVEPGSAKEEIAKHAYSLLMYDYARSYLEKIGGGAEYKLGQTNAIMDTLSVYGYSSPYGNPGPGIMKGLTAKEALCRPTLLTDAENDAEAMMNAHQPDANDNDVGVYTPVYYPIQQHKMPDAEKPYRFQILATMPYETVLAYIKDMGFGGNVNFTYSSSEINSRTNTAGIRTVEQYKEAVAGLADMYEKAEENGGGPKVTEVNTKEMLALNAAGDQDAAYSEETNDTPTKRADNALLGYYASNMTADNVHDLFDVVRSVKGLKYETWYRYYNPVKSEGGDMDLFVTRVSPALNVYMPSVLINGYTCSGSGYINDTLTTTNCSFDYYSTPSFAPCFATHTTDDCYYGILNYEQRVFYSRAFLDSLPRTSIGIPAVELVELADEAMQELTTAEKLDQKDTNRNLAVLYIMTKRLAALKTINSLDVGAITGDAIMLHKDKGKAASVVKQIFGGTELRELDSDIKGRSFSVFAGEGTGTSFDRSLQGLNDAHGGSQHYSGGNPETDDYTWESYEYTDGCTLKINKWYTTVTAAVPDAEPEHDVSRWEFIFYDASDNTIVFKDKDPDFGAPFVTFDMSKIFSDILSDDEIDDMMNASGGSASAESAPSTTSFVNDCSQLSFSESDFLIFKASPIWTKQEGSSEEGMAYINDGNPANKHFEGVKGLDDKDNQLIIGNGGTKAPFLQIDRSLYWTCIYDEFFEQFLGEGGTYYWEDWKTIEQGISSGKDGWPSVSNIPVDDDKGGKVDAVEKTKYGIAFNSGIDILKDKKVGDSGVQSAYEEIMAEASVEIQKFVSNMRQDMQTIADSMPTQMQNCLAWADYQNSSDSEYQYQVDPSDANVTVNVSTNVEQVQYGQGDQKILNLKQLESNGWTISPNEGVISMQDTGAKNGVDTSRDARMVRGVEGSTWTSTQLPAEYTMTATIGRVTALAQTTGTNYPYSGIANGRLMSGTDRYALMQAHVIDYASIASGIAGDLALRQKINVVKVTNPEYSTIPNFFDLIGGIGGVFGELGKGALETTSGWFISVFWQSSSSSGLATSADIQNSAAPAGVYESGYDNGIIMNRVPASINKFDVSTGTMKTGNIADFSSASGSSGSSLASAAGVTRVENILAPWLLRDGAGLYQMLQSFGLILVMICLTIVAFQNFIAYSSIRGQSEQNMLSAQYNLKTVLPRAIFAIFMIGLPPVGNSIGFEGGAYILLQLLGNVVAYMASIFTSVDGSGIMGLWTSMDVSVFGNDLFAYLGFFLFALILSLLFIVGTVAVFIQSIILFAFYLVGPIIWAFYVWPKGALGDGFVNRFPLSLFTKGGDGSNHGAAKAWVVGYVSVAALTALWAIMFWLFSLMFVSSTGIGGSGSVSGTAAELFAGSSGYPSASASLLEDGIFTNVGVPGPVKYLFLILIALILFGLMAKTTMSGIQTAVAMGKSAGMQMYNTAKKNIEGARRIGDKVGGAVGTAKDLRDRATGKGKPYGTQSPVSANGEDLGKKKDAIIANAQQAIINTGSVAKADGLAKGRTTGKKGANIPLSSAGSMPAVASAAAPLVAAEPEKGKKEKKEDGKLLKGLQKGTDALGGASDALASGKLRHNKRKLDAANEVSNALEKAKASNDKDERKALLDGMSADAKNLAEKLGVSKNGELVEGKALDAASEKAGKYQNKLQKKSDELANRLTEHAGQQHSDTYNKVRGSLEEMMTPVLEAADKAEDLKQRALASGLESRKTVAALDKVEDRNYNWQGTDYSKRSAEEAHNDLESASNDLASGYLDAFDNEKTMSSQEKYEKTKALIEGRFGSLISDDTAVALQAQVDAGNAGMLTDAERNSLMAYNAMGNVAGALMPEVVSENMPALAAADSGFQEALDISRERNALSSAAATSSNLLPAAVDAMEASLNPESMSDAMSDFFANSKNWDNMADMLDGIAKADANPEQFGLSREEADKLVSNSQMFKDGSWIDSADGAGAAFREKALSELGSEGYEKALAAADEGVNPLDGVSNSLAAAALSDNATLQKQAAVALEYGGAEMSSAVFDAFAGAGENTSYEDVRNAVTAQLGGQASEANAAYAQAKADYEESLELHQAYHAAGRELAAAEANYGTASPEYGAAKAALAEAERAYAAVPDVDAAEAARDAALAAKQQFQKEQAAAMAMLEENGEAMYNDMHKVAYGVGVDENFIGNQTFGTGAQMRTDFSTLAPPMESGFGDNMAQAVADAPVGMPTIVMQPQAADTINGYAPIPTPTIAEMQLGGNEHVTGEGAIASEMNMSQGFMPGSFANASNAGFFADTPSLGPSEETMATARQMQDDAMMMAAQEKADATVDAALSDADNIRNVSVAKQMAADSKIDAIFDNADRESRHMRDMSDFSMDRMERAQMDMDDRLIDTMYDENERQVRNVRENSERLMNARDISSDKRAEKVADAHARAGRREARAVQEGGVEIADAIRDSGAAGKGDNPEPPQRKPRRSHKTS